MSAARFSRRDGEADRSLSKLRRIPRENDKGQFSAALMKRDQEQLHSAILYVNEMVMTGSRLLEHESYLGASMAFRNAFSAESDPELKSKLYEKVIEVHKTAIMEYTINDRPQMASAMRQRMEKFGREVASGVDIPLVDISIVD
jgi:CRISPR/Cas system-associated exonuclease Cas4 (RecB family)